MAMNPDEAAEMLGVTVEELEQRKQRANERCICPECPTFVEGDEDIAFCFPTIGESGVIETEKSCICGDCPVYDEYDLTKGFFCTRGSEAEQTS